MGCLRGSKTPTLAVNTGCEHWLDSYPVRELHEGQTRGQGFALIAFLMNQDFQGLRILLHI